MSSGRTPVLPAALRIRPIISSSPAPEIGCGVSALGSKKIGSSGPGSAPNFSRKLLCCSLSAAVASSFSDIVLCADFLRRLKKAIPKTPLIRVVPQTLIVSRSACGPSEWKIGGEPLLGQAVLWTCDAAQAIKAFSECSRLSDYWRGKAEEEPTVCQNLRRVQLWNFRL